MRKEQLAALAVSVCLISVVGTFAQSSNGDEEAQSVSKMTLGREAPEGGIEEEVVEFRPGDVPIYCLVDLATDASTEVRFEIVALKAGKMRANSKLVVVKYRTKDGETGATFTGKPEGKWAAGSYRADVYLDGALKASVEFTVSAK